MSNTLFYPLFIKAKVGVNTAGQDRIVRLSRQGLDADFQGHVVRNIRNREKMLGWRLGKGPLQVYVRRADSETLNTKIHLVF